MYCLNLESNDPYFNLAVDEYLLKNNNEDFLILGMNDKSVIIGKHQVAHRETDTKFVTGHHIPVVRRISGGGTVFHDMGNLNFSFILNSRQGKQIDFRRYTKPVIDFLSSVGISAKPEGKNDLKVDGFKISGNAEHVFRERVLHHGTLLFNSDLELLKGSIRNDNGKYITRAVSSNPSSVINLKDVLINVLKYIDDINEFKSIMLKWFLENFPGSEVFHLNQQEIDKVKSLADTKYRTWEWNYAYGPEYHFANRFKVGDKDYFCRLSVKDGIISECEINVNNGIDPLGTMLKGCRHMVSDMKEIINREISIPSGFDIYNLF